MRKPDLVGAAEAWKIAADRSDPRWRPDYDATLAAYLLKARWAHPFWSWWMIAGVHLRPIPGVRPAHRHYPEAEFELTILAIDPTNRGKNPAHDYEPDPDQALAGVPWLEPPDLVYQCHGVTDSDFSRIVLDCVMVIVNGHASPDQDFRNWWRSALNRTVEHYRAGAHRLQ